MYKQAKKQEIMAHALEKSQTIEIVSEEAQILDLLNKGPKSALLNMFEEERQIVLDLKD